MLSTLELIPVPLGDVASDGEGALTLMRVIGAKPRVALVASDGVAFSLAPGDYVFELELRGDGRLEPRLVLSIAGAQEREAPLTPHASFGWRGEVSLAHTVVGLGLALDGLNGAFVIVRCRIAAEADAPAPRLRDALVQGVRALYHKTPHMLRRAVARVVARVPAFVRWRTAALPAVEGPGGQIRHAAANGAEAEELEARRADFDARFAVARGLREEAPPTAELRAKPDTRVVAFYLPQYHRIPENDAWWGAGFTEWTNIAKAVPQFVGHHQPRLPGELGFYDLTAPDTMRRQVDMARAHGVSAFCFHYYWFAGKRLLERPLDAFRADPSLDMSFALCWANENWTRRWDGAEDAVLIAQEHSREDHARVFDDMARYLEDPRALRVGGRPLIIVYRPALIADARAMTEIWRERAAARGWSGIYVAATDAFRFDDPRRLGFDGLVEFPPHGLMPPRIEKRLAWLNLDHRGAVYDYAATAEEAIARLARRRGADYDVFPGVMPGWDNEARRPGAGSIFHDATPEVYTRWLVAACDAAERVLPADRRFVFVNAWNEWAEGAYLEPDRRWGRAFLEATAQVVGAQASTRVKR